jgi:hypothetical protein
MADVFISYKQRMRPKVAVIARALEGLGVSVWFDAELRAGKSFGAVINSELSSAGCVIVCWTPDAFAPDDGSEVSWVEGEATVARERKVIVPIMLERTPLKAPWNMFHTERMMDWNGDPNDAAWLRVLEAIGKLIGRPGLADYAKARAADDPAVLEQFTKAHPGEVPALAGRHRPTARAVLRRIRRVSDTTRWVLGATAVAVVGAIVVMVRMGTEWEVHGTYLDLIAPAASSTVFAFGLWMGRALTFGRAVFSIVAGYVGFLAALFAQFLAPSLAAIIGVPGPGTTLFCMGFLGGAVGAFVALSGVALLLGGVRRREWLWLTVGSVAIGLLSGLLYTGVLMTLYRGSYFWMVVGWTAAFGAMLSWLVAGRSARSM